MTKIVEAMTGTVKSVDSETREVVISHAGSNRTYKIDSDKLLKRLSSLAGRKIKYVEKDGILDHLLTA